MAQATTAACMELAEEHRRQESGDRMQCVDGRRVAAYTRSDDKCSELLFYSWGICRQLLSELHPANFMSC